MDQSILLKIYDFGNKYPSDINDFSGDKYISVQCKVCRGGKWM